MRGLQFSGRVLRRKADTVSRHLRRRLAPVPLVLGAGLALICTACSTSSAPPSTTTSTSTTVPIPTKTDVVFVAPVNSHGQPLEDLSVSQTTTGQCGAGSDSVTGAVTVYRCFGKTYVADPCWAVASKVVPTRTVLCMAAPWSTSVIKLVTQGLPSAKPAGTNLNFPWGIELTSGQRCLAVQGAHESFDGFVVEFNCGHLSGKAQSELALLRGVDRVGAIWSYRSAEVLASKAGNTFSLGPIVHVRVAFYGGA